MKPTVPPIDSEADGPSTRERILAVATDLFAEHGYRGATVRAICAKVGVNVASVNYYFRSKNELYEEVFSVAFEDLAKPMIERSNDVRDAASWEGMLRDWVLFMLRINLLDTPKEARVRRLLAHERATPSGVCGLLFERFFQPVTASLERLLRMGLAPEATDAEVRLWLVATLSQCTVFQHRDPPWDSFLIPPGIDRATWIARLADHIVGNILRNLRFRGFQRSVRPE